MISYHEDLLANVKSVKSPVIGLANSRNEQINICICNDCNFLFELSSLIWKIDGWKSVVWYLHSWANNRGYYLNFRKLFICAVISNNICKGQVMPLFSQIIYDHVFWTFSIYHKIYWKTALDITQPSNELTCTLSN